ncbi:MAG: hypothetical protein N4A38_04260 [Candidatus Gracilibacteria bacterium]|nr:hypothetical protein [Candidatus Gracilibacteria bacterium]
MKLYWLVIFAVLINSFGAFIYILNTLKGKTKPNRITWLIWATAPLVGSAGMIASEGFVWSALPVFMSGFLPLLVFLSSFVNKKSYWKLGHLDYTCLSFALLAIILWQITDNPLLAIIFSVLADGLGAIPLLIKMYKYPETETISPFFTGLIANISALIVIKNWTIEEYLFPVYLLSICSLIILTYYRKKFFKFIPNFITTKK